MTKAANTYTEACAIMRIVQYGERVHRAALRLQKRAIVRNDSQWLRDLVKSNNDDPKQWVGEGIPVKLVAEGEQ